MDQVKQVLAVLKKQHFWVLSGILIVVGLGAWHFAVAKLDTQYKERETKLNSQRKAVKDIASSTDPPNQAVIDAIGESHKKAKEEVYKAWTVLYQVQKESNPWPPPPVLSAEFIEAAEALKPGENYLKPGEEFKDWKYPEHYWNFIKEYLPRLGVIVDVREPKSAREERLKPKAARRPVVKKKIEKKKPGETASAEEKKAAEDSAEEEIVGKVIWDNELAIAQQFEWDTRPTTLQVLVAQENLWVYEALLRIVRDTNEGSNSYYKAPVKQIFSLEIGREAAAALTGSRSQGGSGTSMMGGGMMGGGMMGGGMMGSSGSMGAMTGSGGSGGSMGSGGAMSGGSGAASGSGGSTSGAEASASPQEAVARALLDGRYVDQKGQPLVYGTDPQPPQFKMMPVRMLLLVNQRHLPRLLAQCANSTMPVEVKRVILRPDQVQALSLGGASGSAGASGMGMGGMGGASSPGGAEVRMSSPYGSGSGGSSGSMPGGMSGMKAGGMPSMPTGKSSSRASGSAGSMPGAGSGGDEESHWDMKVEIQGIIYIFNAPDRAKFDIGETAAAGPGASPAPAAQPGGAATPAAPGAETAAPGKTAAPTPAPAASGATPAPAGAPKAPADTAPAPGTTAAPKP